VSEDPADVAVIDESLTRACEAEVANAVVPSMFVAEIYEAVLDNKASPAVSEYIA
jgi:hypothetical protein